MKNFQSYQAFFLVCSAISCLNAGSPIASAEETPTNFNAYFIGNSLTGGITLDRLNSLVHSQAIDYEYGSQIGAGATLNRHYELTGGLSSSRQSQEFGLYTDAFTNHEWDAIILQPFDRALGDMNCCTGDVKNVQNFVNYYTANNPNPNANFYIYNTWMKRETIAGNDALDTEDPTRYVPLDYQARWDETYVQPRWGPGAWATRDFGRQLVEITKANNPELAERLFIVPVGDVLYELDERIKSGLIPGLDSPHGVEQLYVDQIHLTSTKNWPPLPSIGTYVMGLTFYSTLFKASPIGLSGSLWGLDDTENAGLILALQETVWDVVNGHPYSGVSVLEENAPGVELPLLASASLPLGFQRFFVAASPEPIAPESIATPEPLTLSGASTAIALGSLFKLFKRQKQKQKP